MAARQGRQPADGSPICAPQTSCGLAAGAAVFVRAHTHQFLGRVDADGLGVALPAPMDVILTDHDVVEPVLLCVSKDRLSIVTEDNVPVAPDLVVEIISEGSP